MDVIFAPKLLTLRSDGINFDVPPENLTVGGLRLATGGTTGDFDTFTGTFVPGVALGGGSYTSVTTRGVANTPNVPFYISRSGKTVTMHVAAFTLEGLAGTPTAISMMANIPATMRPPTGINVNAGDFLALDTGIWVVGGYCSILNAAAVLAPADASGGFALYIGQEMHFTWTTI